MSLLGRESPKKTRQTKQQEEISLEPLISKASVDSFPDLENKETDSKLVDLYKYKGESDIKIDSLSIESSSKEPAVVPTEQELLLKENINKNVITFLDMIHFCEIYIMGLLNDPIDLKIEKMRKLEAEFITSKLKIFSNSSEAVVFGPIKDIMYYRDGDLILVEELFGLSGFFREHFNIKNVLVITRNGLLESRESLYCQFWTKDKIKELAEMGTDSFNQSIHMITNNQKDRCNRCILGRELMAGKKCSEQSVNKL